MSVAIESGFPSAMVNVIAEQESWRKEINRPTYHLHKWWATRLGSVFRAIIIGALSPEGADVGRAFFEAVQFPGAVVLDPMMGSGTTIGEALKLGCRVVGQDINPVSYIQVRKAIEHCDNSALAAAYARLKHSTAPIIQELYRVTDPDDTTQKADTLYAFWVKTVSCPTCSADVRLFTTHIFARHAYPKRVPDVHSLCPICGEVNRHHGAHTSIVCRNTHNGTHVYNPHDGAVNGAKATCWACHMHFRILDAIAEHGLPRHELYASLVLTADGKKVYVRARADDLMGISTAAERLAEERLAYPLETIEPGYNTDQLRSHGYRQWSELFTARQLYSLALLAQAIRDEPDADARGILALLLSGTVEFNNLLCSYKGEGTGAVRPAFSHHILKPERTPLENTVWGLPQSSGCFSTLYKSRVLPALAYRQRPFELRVIAGNDGKAKGEKIFGLGAPMSVPLARDWSDLKVGGPARALIRCGDARTLPLPDASVDAIITDPPYFDFVHYSELADLFHGWLRLMLADEYPALSIITTRQPGEIQQKDPAAFAAALGDVLTECERVLKPTGILAFSFHHSRDDGWAALGHAVLGAGLAVVAAHPVKAELSVATPKSAANEAIDIDAILVCKRRSDSVPAAVDQALREVAASASSTAAMYRATAKRSLSRNDLRVILQSQALRVASRHYEATVDQDGLSVPLDVFIRESGRLLDSFILDVNGRRVAG